MKKTEKRKGKEPIKLWLKALKTGQKSLYLKAYKEGTKGNGYDYECLKLYLLPGTSREVKAKNKEIWRIAETIKAQRLIDIANGKAGIKPRLKRKEVTLNEWLECYAQKKAEVGQSKSRARTILNVKLHLAKYHKGDIELHEINKAFCEGFIKYLSNARTIVTGKPQRGKHVTEKPISKSTANLYFKAFTSILHEAVRQGVIESNPIGKISREEKKSIAGKSVNRPYLEGEELLQLINTSCSNDTIKQAFLFACFCGLRYSDISNLTWGNFVYSQKGRAAKIVTIQKKTNQRIEVPLPGAAEKWLPQRGGAKDVEKVFRLPCYQIVNEKVKQWAENSGISKKITFHVARHTYATRLLTMGADLYTVSKLLGHQNLRTTQIYAEIVDKKKEEAVNLLNKIL